MAKNNPDNIPANPKGHPQSAKTPDGTRAPMRMDLAPPPGSLPDGSLDIVAYEEQAQP